MKIYFLSSRPCALTLNDAYFGLTDRFERFAEISLKDNVFVRFSPENAQPIGFFLNESVRHTPPVGCEVYLLPNALAIYAHDFPPHDLTLKIVTHLKKQPRCKCAKVTDISCVIKQYGRDHGTDFAKYQFSAKGKTYTLK